MEDLVMAGKMCFIEDINRKQKHGKLTGCFYASFYPRWEDFGDDSDVAFTGFWWVGVQTYRKRRELNLDEKEYQTFTGGFNLIPWYIEQIVELQRYIRLNQLNTPIIIYGSDSRRRHLYERFFTKKLGFFATHWTDDASIKVLMWKPDRRIRYGNSNENAR